MSFFNETILKLGLAPENCVGGYKITIYDGIGMQVEGHKGVLSVSDEEITIRLKGAKLIVRGENLATKAIDGEEIYIVGKIMNISRE